MKLKVGSRSKRREEQSKSKIKECERERDAKKANSAAASLCPSASVHCPLSLRAMDWKNPSLNDDAPRHAWKRPLLDDGEKSSPPAAGSSSSAAAGSWKRPKMSESTVHCPQEDQSAKTPKAHREGAASWKTPQVDDTPPPPSLGQPSRRAPRHEVNLCRVMLQLILPGEVNNDNKYRQDAANTDRINAALSKRYCSSKGCALCGQKLRHDDMHDLVQLWMKLGDEVCG